MPCSSSAREQWQCIAGCGACCRLDPGERGEALDALNPEQRELYLSMVGPDGWCIHFDTGGRRCRIYDERPTFCRVENLVTLFGASARGDARQGDVEEGDAGDDPDGLDPNALAIACCKQQIRSEYGGRGRVMRRFLRTIRRLP
jgi:hypothetical protein